VTKDKSGRRILLVDDNKNLLITLADYLTFSGYEVDKAKSGEEALRRIEKSVPDLIVLDISMPGMGGIGFLKRISEDGDKPKYPVLVLTARSAMENFFSSISVDGFLCKPCAEERLLEKIEEILTTREAEVRREESTARRLLLAEDDEDVLRRLVATLSRAGYEVEVAASGPEVIERAPVERPDIIVLKEILPRMNGGVVASLIGTMASTRTIPVVLYDETVGPGERGRYGSRMPDGVDRFLSTTEPRDLLAAVNEILGK